MSDASARSLREEVEAMTRPERSRLRVVESPSDALEAADLGLPAPRGRRFVRQAPGTPERGDAPPADRHARTGAVAHPADPPEFMAPGERPAPPGPPHPRSRIRPDLDPSAPAVLPTRSGADSEESGPAAASRAVGAAGPGPTGERAGFSAPAIGAPATVSTPTPRRTVRITGQAARHPARPRPSASARGSRPDRLAMWAVALALFMAFMAAATAEASSPDSHEPPAVSAAVVSTH